MGGPDCWPAAEDAPSRKENTAAARGRSSDVRIAATGSASSVLRAEGQESGAGRWLEIPVPTPSFHEDAPLCRLGVPDLPRDITPTRLARLWTARAQPSLRLRRISVGQRFGAGPRGSKGGAIYQFETQRPVGVAGGVGAGGVGGLDQGCGDLGEAGQGRRLDLHHVRFVPV